MFSDIQVHPSLSHHHLTKMNANGNNFFGVTFTCHATSRLDTIGSWAILQYHSKYNNRKNINKQKNVAVYQIFLEENTDNAGKLSKSII